MKGRNLMLNHSKPVLLVLSGGQDSTTCAYLARQMSDEVHAVTFDYGQKHSIELEAATLIAELVDCTSHEIIKIPDVLKGSSPLVNPDEALEQYDDHDSLPGGLEKTFVPARNALFLTLAANRAYNLNISTMITGVCQEDFGGYPDCRAVFIKSMECALSLAHDRDFDIMTPLMFMTKAESVQLAMTMPGCYKALAYSHTAYDGAYPPTGHDHATLLREKGFVEAGVPDPLVVRAWAEGFYPMDKFPAGPNYDVCRASAQELAVIPTTGSVEGTLNVLSHLVGAA